jgi:hypothetical protein
MRRRNGSTPQCRREAVTNGFSAVRRILFVPLIAFGLLAAPCARAQNADSSAERWQFAITPYLWLPNVDGTLKFSVPPGAGGSPEVGVGPNDYLSNLDFALFLAGEARRGRWAIITDIIYLDFSNEEGAVKSVTGPGGGVQVPVNANTQTGVKGLVWSLAASYTVSRSSASTFDVLGGLRYAGLEASVDWQLAGPTGLLPQSGSFSQNVDLWDAIIGVRGKARLGESGWFVPYYLDAGTGSSALTWQGMAGIGHTFKWGDVLLAYRHLYYDQKGDKLIQDMRFSGPALGATFRF